MLLILFSSRGGGSLRLSFIIFFSLHLFYTWCICCWASLLGFLNWTECTWKNVWLILTPHSGQSKHRTHLLWATFHLNILTHKKNVGLFVFYSVIKSGGLLCLRPAQAIHSQDFKICIGWNAARLYASFNKNGNEDGNVWAEYLTN